MAQSHYPGAGDRTSTHERPMSAVPNFSSTTERKSETGPRRAFSLPRPLLSRIPLTLLSSPHALIAVWGPRPRRTGTSCLFDVDINGRRLLNIPEFSRVLRNPSHSVHPRGRRAFRSLLEEIAIASNASVDAVFTGWLSPLNL